MTYSFGVTGRPQPKDKIAECFRLFRVVVKGPKMRLLLVGFASDIRWGSWGAKIFAYGKCLCIKRVILRKYRYVPFGA